MNNRFAAEVIVRHQMYPARTSRTLSNSGPLFVYLGYETEAPLQGRGRGDQGPKYFPESGPRQICALCIAVTFRIATGGRSLGRR